MTNPRNEQFMISEYSALTSNIDSHVKYLKNTYYTAAFGVIVITGFAIAQIHSFTDITVLLPFSASLLSLAVVILSFLIYTITFNDLYTVQGYISVFYDQSLDSEYGYNFFNRVKRSRDVKKSIEEKLEEKYIIEKMPIPAGVKIYAVLNILTYLPITYYLLDCSINDYNELYLLILHSYMVLIGYHIISIKDKVINEGFFKSMFEWEILRDNRKDLVKLFKNSVKKGDK